jgi:hypothetical protein
MFKPTENLQRNMHELDMLKDINKVRSFDLRDDKMEDDNIDEMMTLKKEVELWHDTYINQYNEDVDDVNDPEVLVHTAHDEAVIGMKE